MIGKTGEQIRVTLSSRGDGLERIIEEGDDLICLICSEFKPEIEHSQPFLDGTGRWLCGTCWFRHRTISIMTPRRHQAEVTV